VLCRLELCLEMLHLADTQAQLRMCIKNSFWAQLTSLCFSWRKICSCSTCSRKICTRIMQPRWRLTGGMGRAAESYQRTLFSSSGERAPIVVTNRRRIKA